MPNIHRKAKAKAAAEEYAPKPQGSALTYGFIGVVLALLGLVVFGLYYRADVFSHPLVIACMLAVVFLGGVILRKRRKRLHLAAYEQEYEKHDNSPPK